MSVLFPWRVLAREQEELLGLNLAHHLHSYALLIYAKMHTTSLDIWLKHHFDVLFIDAKKCACLSSMLSLISMEFFKVLRNELPGSVYSTLNWHEILKCYWCPWVFPAI